MNFMPFARKTKQYTEKLNKIVDERFSEITREVEDELYEISEKFVEVEKEIAEGIGAGGIGDTVTKGYVDKKSSENEKKIDRISSAVEDNSRRLGSVEDRVKSVEDDVKNIVAKSNEAGRQYTDQEFSESKDYTDRKMKGTVRYDVDENGNPTNSISLGGVSSADPVTIKNVADGRIEKGSRDAANGGQLHDYVENEKEVILEESNIQTKAVQEAIGNNRDNRIELDRLDRRIGEVTKEARKAASIAIAIANLRYDPEDGGGSMAFSSGYWKGQTAIAFGYNTESGRFRYNALLVASGEDVRGGAGVSYKLR